MPPVEGPFRDPEIPDGEESTFRGLIAGEENGTGRLRVERVERDGRPYYRQLLSMRILGEAEYEGELLFRRDSGHIISESYRLETLHKGERVAVEEGYFRGVKTLQWGGVLEPFPRDVAALLGCAVALRGLDFERDARRTFSLWLANTVHWEIESHMEQIEEVELPAGRFRAWRVRVRPDFTKIAGKLDALIALVLPPFTLHFEAAAPHRFLRFEFPTGPFRWNPHGVIEATELSDP